MLFNFAKGDGLWTGLDWIGLDWCGGWSCNIERRAVSRRGSVCRVNVLNMPKPTAQTQMPLHANARTRVNWCPSGLCTGLLSCSSNSRPSVLSGRWRIIGLAGLDMSIAMETLGETVFQLQWSYSKANSLYVSRIVDGFDVDVRLSIEYLLRHGL